MDIFHAVGTWHSLHAVVGTSMSFQSNRECEQANPDAALRKERAVRRSQLLKSASSVAASEGRHAIRPDLLHWRVTPWRKGSEVLRPGAIDTVVYAVQDSSHSQI